MTNPDPVPVAVYKTMPLGDYITGYPTMKVAGEGVSVKSALYGTRSSVVDRGAKTWFETSIQSNIKRSYTSTESVEVFWQRKVALVSTLASLRGYLPTTSTTTYGILAVCDNSQNVFQVSSGVAAGSTVTIAISAPFGGTRPSVLASGELWYIFDVSTSLAELFVVVAGSVTNQVKATTLVNAYTTSAFCFRVLVAVQGAYMEPGIEIPGNDTEGATEAMKDVEITFTSVDAPQYGTAV